MNTTDFRTSSYFSWHFIAAAVGLVFVALALIGTSTVLATILLLACLAVFTTHYRVRVDTANKIVHDYVWLLGLKLGSAEKFEALEYIFIKRNRESQTMHVRIASTTVEKDVYDAYLKLSETHKVHLFTADAKEALMKKVTPVAAQLKVEVLDRTD